MGHAICKYSRISSKKANRIAKLIRMIPYLKALSILSYLPQLPAKVIKSTLKSAGANLSQRYPDSTEDMWYVKTVLIMRGPYYKRIQTRSRGSANRIHKPLSHVKIVVDQLKKEK